ncbi:hypothetical protein JTE90_021736 [Oedothorax gibbosus]|uniref:Uncharacterized protein n=1 Tax=Oedothorax gibbosus TaxID=931172 RepID=A0AAV6UGA4_9ARAC|nr:hypothetical protein JTE90_021736 [Oedothorax gibbosus]
MIEKNDALLNVAFFAFAPPKNEFGHQIPHYPQVSSSSSILILKYTHSQVSSSSSIIILKYHYPQVSQSSSILILKYLVPHPQVSLSSSSLLLNYPHPQVSSSSIILILKYHHPQISLSSNLFSLYIMMRKRPPYFFDSLATAPDVKVCSETSLIEFVTLKLKVGKDGITKQYEWREKKHGVNGIGKSREIRGRAFCNRKLLRKLFST